MDVKFHVGPLDDDEKSGDELESNRDEEQELLITHKHNNGNNKNNNNKSNSSNNKNNNNKNNNEKCNTSSNVICNVNACYSGNVGSDATVNIVTNEPTFEPASHVLTTFDELSHGGKLMHSKIIVSASFDEKTEKRPSSSSASEPNHDDDDDEIATKFKSNPNLSGRRISNMKKSNAEAYVNVSDNSKSNNSDNISNIIVVNISATGNNKEDFYNEINNISKNNLNKTENFTPFLKATNNTNITKNGKSINNNHINHKIGEDNGNMSVPTIGNKAFIHNSKLENLKKIGRQSVESEMGKHFLKPKPDVNMRKWSLTSAPIITVNAFEGDESFSTKTAELQAIFNRRRSSNNEQKDGEPATKTDKNCEEIEKQQSDKQSQRKKIWVDSNDHSFRSRLGSDDSHDQTSCFPNSGMWLLSSQSHAHSTSMTPTDDNDKSDNQFNGSNNRLTAVAKHFFQRRRSHQNCLINTMSPDDEEIITSNANNKTKLTKDNKNNKDERNGSKKSTKRKPKPTGIEAILRQSCSDVRNLLVGDGSLFFSAGGGLSSGGLFQKNRRQSTVGLFQPGPRISPLPFEQHNGTPGMHMRLNYFGVPYMMGPALTSTTSLTTTSSMTSSIAPAMTTTNISPLPQKLATPAIVCDGVLTVPSTLADQQLNKNNTDNNNNISNNTDNNNNNSNQLTVNSLDANFLALNMFGSQQQLVGGQARRRSVMLTPRSSFLVTNQPSLDFRDSDLSINYPNCNDESEELSLIYLRLEKIPMKDFAAEIRAHLDVEHFLNQAQLMLDMQENNMSEILDVMLKHLLGDEESATAYIEAKKVLFTRDAAQQLAKTIQCTCSTFCGGYDYDPSWVCVLCTVSSVQRRHVAIARLRNPANFGRTSQEVLFIILVVTSTKEKGTKTALETGRTFATLFADVDLRLRLLGARSEQEFKQLMWEHMKDLAEEQQCMGQARNKRRSKDSVGGKSQHSDDQNRKKHWMGSGLMEDWKKRAPHYLADYTDGFCGQNTLHKTLSTTFFLYFACILPAIALGVLYYNNTSGPSGEGQIDVRKVIYSQTISGLTFAVFGGQPMVILLTTAPLAIYTKVIFNICEDLKLDFAGMFACTGLWNSFFLLIYAFTDASKLMRWCTRSTEEIFALFISLALAVDAFRNVFYDFRINYHSPACYKNQSIPSSPSLSSSSSSSSSSTALLNNSLATAILGSNNLENNKTIFEAGGKLLAYASECSRENSLLYLLLMLGTAWLGLSLYNFTKTPFLNASKRELMADCALPVSVLLMSFFGSYLFRDVKLKKFKTIDGNIFTPAPLSKLEWPAILGGMGLGFCLSLLFFMDHYIAGALVNSTDNRLKKGSAYHWDLMIIGLLNAFLSFFGLPLVHGALPHSPLHVRAMADVEDRVYQGHVYLKIIRARETRVTGICSHILIGLSLFYIEELKKIPRPVLDGLFLYLAITALHSNQLFERIMLMFTEQAAYPPNHYIRTVPQRKVHLFTLLQLLQLAVLCGFGFSSIPYLKMVFPILHLVMLPIRHKLVPYLIEKKYLQSLDGH